MSGTSRDDGFSLVELLLVILILGILSTVVLLSVGGITGRAEDSACLSDRRLLEAARDAYFAQSRIATITPSGSTERYEHTLVEAGLLRQVSQYYDLDEHGQLVQVAGSPCTI